MMKKLTALVLALLTTVICVGCGYSNDPISMDDFQSTLEEAGLTVTDEPADQAYKCEALKSASDADGTKYTFVYYDLQDEDAAVILYDNMCDVVKEKFGDVIKSQSETSNNHSGIFKATTDSNFYEVARNQDCVLCVQSTKEASDDAKNIIEDLGY